MTIPRNFEKVVLREAFIYQRHALREFGCFCMVQQSCKPSARAKRVLDAQFPGATSIAVTPVVTLNKFGRALKGDLVLTKSNLVTHVWLQALVDGAVSTMLSYCTKLTATTWRIRSEPCFVSIDELSEALIFSRFENIVTIVPPLGL